MSEPIKEFRVLTSGAFTAALVALTPSLESVLGKRVIAASTSIGIGESYIPTRLKRGEIADLVIVADDVLRDCVSDGLVLAAAYTPLVISLIGMAVRQSAPKPDISTVEAFKQTLLNAKSITYLKEGASTIHLRKLFVQLGVADAVKQKAVETDGEQVSEFVAEGKVELGLIVTPNIMSVPGAELVGSLPAEINSIVMFTAGVSAQSPNQKAASDLIKLLTSPEAKPVIKAKGNDPA